MNSINSLTLNLGKTPSMDLLDNLRESFVNSTAVDFSLASCVPLKINLTSFMISKNFTTDEWTLEIEFMIRWSGDNGSDLSKHKPFDARPNIKGIDFVDFTDLADFTDTELAGERGYDGDV